MGVEDILIGFGLGVGPGLILAAVLIMRALAQVIVMLKDFAGIAKTVANAVKAPAGPSGLLGLASTFLPMLTNVGRPR